MGSRSYIKNLLETLIRLTGDTCLDIRKGQESLDKYRATLGHKACHSFAPNAAFAELHHPRFGDIMSIVAKRDIDRGEEVLVCYNYAIHQAKCRTNMTGSKRVSNSRRLNFHSDEIFPIASEFC